MKRANIFEIPHLRTLGRYQETLARDAGVLPLFWADSGFELRFTGRELCVILEADFSHADPWIAVEVNGAPLIRMPLNRGINEVRVFQNMVSGSVKHVRLLKEIQPVWDDPRHHLWVRELRWEGGEFLPLPELSCRLEFVGDSLTSGEGVIGAKEESDWSAAIFSASRSWAKRAADALNAEFRAISQSGWGVLSGWDNDPRRAIPNCYESVCGPALGEADRALGSQERYDFSTWQPDAVIVNLGANDAGAMSSPPWKTPDGKLFQQNAGPDGLRRFEDAALAFLQTIRRRNPASAIFWAHGMLDEFLRTQLESAIARFQSESGDQRVWYLPLPAVKPDGLGSRMHPGPACHRDAAAATARFLQEKM